MSKANESEAYPIRVKPYVLALALIWSATVTASLVWNTYQARQEIIDVARIQARGSFMKDVLYRRWNAGHGGVYVPVTDETPSNPYLEVPERDVTTRSGIDLTLMNPAYMTRQVHEIAVKTHGIIGHITSLNPIRPANTPDPWETQALEAFKSGAKEVSSVESIKGDDYMRLMRPLVTEEGCLKCHASQGYKVGDIRGGISVSVPMSPLRVVERSYLLTLYLGHGLLWLVGLAGIGLGARRLNKQIIGRKQAEEIAVRAKQEWERTFNAVPDLIAIIDDKHRIVRVNRAMADKLGVAPEEAVDLTCYEHVHGKQEPPTNCPHAKLLADGQEHMAEVYEKRLGGDFLVTVTPLHDAKGHLVGSVHVARDITDRKRTEKEREKLIHELQNVLAKVKTLSGLLPICSSCKKVRDDKGYWSQIETYIREHSEADFSHSICPECAKKIYPDLDIHD